MAPSTSSSYSSGSRHHSRHRHRMPAKKIQKQPSEGDQSGMIMLLGTMVVVLVGALLTIASFSV